MSVSELDNMKNTLSIAVVMTFSVLLALLFSPLTRAESNVTQPLDWFTMLMWLTGGLALFLFGMEQMKNLLSKLTNNRLMGALTGAGITAVYSPHQ